MTVGLVWVLLMFSFCFILFSIFICMSVSPVFYVRVSHAYLVFKGVKRRY